MNIRKGDRVRYISDQSPMYAGREGYVTMIHVNRPMNVRVKLDGLKPQVWVNVRSLLVLPEPAEVNARIEYMAWHKQLMVKRARHNPERAHPEFKWTVRKIRSGKRAGNWIARDPQGIGSFEAFSREEIMLKLQEFFILDYDLYLEQIWSKPCTAK